MIVARTTFQAKYGQGDALVALLKEGRPMLEAAGAGSQRTLTDASGRFFTVVLEMEYDSLGAYETSMAEMFGNPEFGAFFERMTGLVESGEREFLNIVD